MKAFKLLLAGSVLIAFQSCDSGPKVIPVAADDDNSTGVFDEEGHTHHDHDGHNHQTRNHGPAGAATADVHTITVKEVLPTTKYVYLYVEENGEEFWIATSKTEVTVGEQYFYKNGLLKTNFESKEHNRLFEKIYLVNQIVPVKHGQSATASSDAEPVQIDTHGKDEVPLPTGDVDVEGSVRIAALVENPKEYEGKRIQLSGVVTKVNHNIMDRNWLHLKDGSKNDYDLVVTSSTAVPEGHTVTLMATVVLNKDFGAGYQYDIILEEGEIVR